MAARPNGLDRAAFWIVNRVTPLSRQITNSGILLRQCGFGGTRRAAVDPRLVAGIGTHDNTLDDCCGKRHDRRKHGTTDDAAEDR